MQQESEGRDDQGATLKKQKRRERDIRKRREREDPTEEGGEKEGR
jgi:hypothetical protein